MQPSQLRPMRIGDLLDTSFRFYRAHAAQLLTLTLIVLLPMTLVRLLLLATPIAEQLLDSLQSVFLLPLACAALTAAGTRIYTNQTIAPAQLLREGARRYLSILGAIFLEGLFIGVPIALIVGCLGFGLLSRGPTNPIIWVLLAIIVIPYIVLLGTKFAITFPAIVIEGINASAGVKRSWALTKGRFWHTAGAAFATSILTILLSQLPAISVACLTTALAAGTTTPWLAALQLILVQLGLIITLPFQYLVPVVLYYDLRIRNEGYDLDQALNAAKLPSTS